MKIKLAEALLRRKELAQKVAALTAIKRDDLFTLKVVRKNVTDNVDDITATVPKLTAAEVLAEYDWHARQLRLVDAAIQQVNWTAEVEVNDSVMTDYKPDRALLGVEPTK